MLCDEIGKILEEMDERPVISDCVRVKVNNSSDARPRPVKFSLKPRFSSPQELNDCTRKRGIDLFTFAPIELLRKENRSRYF